MLIFCTEEILFCYESTVCAAVRARRGRFQESEYDELEDYVTAPKLLEDVARADKIGDDYAANVPQGIGSGRARSSGSGGGFLAALLGVAVGLGHKKGHNGRCNGDCARCPDHYGYRYGRWYYGKHHTEGCELGGNDGSGKP